MVGEATASVMMCSSPGFCLRNVGGVGIPGGSSGAAAAIADSTSTAAPSMSRPMLNCSVMEVEPMVLDEIIESTPAMVVNCRSRTVATEDAIVAGLAPGSDACTWMVGKSICGTSLTESARYAIIPNIAIASISRLVAIGFRIKGSEKFNGQRLRAAIISICGT